MPTDSTPQPPPLEAGPDPDGAQKSKWPKVLGIFAIVLGAVSILTSISRPIGALAQEFQM